MLSPSATSSETGPPPPEELSDAADEAAKTASVNTVKECHHALMREYVDVLVYFRNCGAEGRDARGANLVRSHIKRRLSELEVAYLYRAHALPAESNAGKWYRSALESIREFSETLPSHSAWRGMQGLVSTAWKVAIPIAGIVSLAQLNSLRDVARESLTRVEGAMGGSYAVRQMAVMMLGSVLYWPLHTRLGGFYRKRRALLGGDSDMQLMKTVTGLRPEGGNAYKLETDLFNALKFVKSPEGQRDAELFWALLLFLMMVWWVPLLFDTPLFVHLALPIVAAVTLPLALLFNWRAGKRAWK